MSHKRRIPRFVLVTVGLFLALEAITGGMLGLVRATHRHYVCLYFAPGWVIDLSSGLGIADRRPLPVKANQLRGWFSPDGKYNALRDWTESGKPKLVARPLSGGGTPIVLEDDVSGGVSIQFYWAPVSPVNASRIAYTWVTKSGQLTLAVADLSETGFLQKTVKPLKANLIYNRWSPDGAYFAFAVAGEGTLRFWSMADQREMNFPLLRYLEQLVWAPDGRQFVYLHDDIQSVWLTIAAPGTEARTFDLQRPFSEAHLSWSPGGRYIAVAYIADWPRWHIDVFGVEGSRFNVADVALHNDSPFRVLTHWSDDGQALLYMQDRHGGAWDWLAFYPGQNRYETVVANLLTPPSYASESQDQRMALKWRSQTGQQNVAVMDSDGARRTMLAENADDAGNPNWSQDGQFAAVVWATSQQANRVVHVSIARQDGSGLLVLDDHFWDVRDLRSPSDGKSLAFVARRGDAQGNPVFSAEAIDLETGQLRRLAGGFVQISMFATDAHNGGITFWWQLADGQIGADAYKPDGTRLYRFRADASTGVSINGQSSQGQYWITLQPGSPKVFPAPDGSIAALKLGPLGNESLQLASSDGAWTRLIRSGLSGLGDPLWSPDGRMLAFTQSVNHNPVTLSVIRADGSLVQDISRFEEGYGSLTWTKCD